jgi:hypothetical protein
MPNLIHPSRRAAVQAGVLAFSVGALLTGAAALTIGRLPGAEAARTELVAVRFPSVPLQHTVVSLRPLKATSPTDCEDCGEEENENEPSGPPVPVGPPVPNTPSAARSVAAPEAAGPEAPARLGAESAEVVVKLNTSLGVQGHQNITASTGEPSVAVNGDVVFYTGNWYAALSTNGGKTFSYVDPFTSFPEAGGGFCCDQVTTYIPQADLFVWLLQYTQVNQRGENVERIALASTEDVKAGNWSYFDIKPGSLGLTNEWLDYPDLSFSDNYLYVTANAFTGDANRNWDQSIILRYKLADLLAGRVRPEGFGSGSSGTTRGNFNFRVAQHCTNRAYWASHNNTSSLRVFSWAEGGDKISLHDVNVGSWSGTSSSFVSPTVGGFNWLGRVDSRVMAATRRGAELWFGWTSGAHGDRGKPYARIVRIDSGTFKRIAEIDIWNRDIAFAYPAIDSAPDGRVGMAVAYAGRSIAPSTAVGFLTDDSPLATVARGDFGPEHERWGDYLTVRRVPGGNLLAATAFGLTGGQELQGTADPHYVVFDSAGQPTKPKAPGSLRAKAVTGGIIRLNWKDRSTNETGFQVQYKAPGKPYETIGETDANATGGTVQGAQKGKKYSFRVRAFNDEGKSGFSNVATVRAK